MSDSGHYKEDQEDLKDRIDALEARLSALERDVHALQSVGAPPHRYLEYDTGERSGLSFNRGSEGESAIESRIGEYGLAWVGSIVLFFGIIFLNQYIINLKYPLLAAITGYLSVAGMLFGSWKLKRTYSYISFLFSVFGQVLLFYVTLRLHFYTPDPVIQAKWIGIVVLFLVIGVQVYLAVKKQSEFFSIIALLMLVAVGVVSENTHMMLLAVTLGGAGSVFLFFRHAWYRLLMFSIVFAYITFFNWILNNPLAGNPIKGITQHQYTFIYLAGCAAIFSMATLIRKSDKFPKRFILTSILVNGLSFTALLWLWVAVFFPNQYIWLFLAIALFCIPFSIILKTYSDWIYAPALYALYGFVAISVAIYGYYKFPDAFFLLSIQSFLVASIAIWYRSRIIVVMNVFLFLIILFTYLVTSSSNHLINFSFPVIAFLSVLVITWQQERLNIRTELIKNTYLITLLITMLYALFRGVPGPYVTLSWTLAGVLFFLLSLLLKKIKYRWMALASVIATAIYLFAVDLANVEIVYRIVAFLFLAMISIGISIYYVKKIKKRQTTDE